MGEAHRGIGERRVRFDRRIGRIDGNVDLVANSLDDARIDLPVEGLRAAAVIGVGVNDGGAGAGAGDALGDNRRNRVGIPGCSARLQAPFSAASIQTLRMARFPFVFSFEPDTTQPKSIR